MSLDSIHRYVPLSRGFEIDRPRLRERLELAARHTLTLLTAPPGYGKTTAAAQFAHQTSQPVIWHTIEERERDVPNLNAHCITALADLIPDIQELAMRGGSHPDEAAALIADQLRAHSPDSLVYIFDDAHHLIGSPGAEAWLRSLIALLPPSCHLILIGRELPNLPLAEKVLRQEVLVLGLDQLRFTAEEARELARAIGQSFPANEVDRITLRLDGWPAGTVLALQPPPAELEAVLFKGGNSPESFFDTLAEIMLKAQPPTLRNFLLASSTLSRMTPDLCHTVLRLPNSLEHLKEVFNRNLFVSEVSGGFVYHSLFRNFLQRQLHERQPALFLDLHLQAGGWFEENNQLENAFEHFLAADRPQRAAAIAERAAQAYHSQGRIETLLYWASRLRQATSQAPRPSRSLIVIKTGLS
jgi:LuxR family maltose regulon positive regulatory protein